MSLRSTSRVTAASSVASSAAVVDPVSHAVTSTRSPTLFRRRGPAGQQGGPLRERVGELGGVGAGVTDDADAQALLTVGAALGEADVAVAAPSLRRVQRELGIEA